MKHKKTIAYRITKAMLLMCIVTLLASALFSGIARMRLQNLLRDSGTDIGISVSRKSADTLLEKSVSATQDFIAAKTEVLDAYLKNIKDNLTIMQSRAAELFAILPGSEIDLYGELSSIAKTIMRLNSDIINIYIVTENGNVVFFEDQAIYKRIIEENNIILTERPWYLAAKETGTVSITDTYQDVLGRGLCITISIPVYARNGGLIGVIGADIGMHQLSNMVSEVTVGGVEFVILAGQNGVIASSILGVVEGAEQLPPGTEDIWNHSSGVMTLAVPVITSHVPRYIESYIIWDSFTLTNWKLIGFNPIGTVIAPAEEIRASISDLTDDLVARAQAEGMRTGILTMFALAGVLVFAILYARRTSIKISAPIVSLTDDAIKIGQGELNRILEIKTGDEIETLTDTINKMVADIKHITGEKERIGAELDVATKIQASMLPCIFPAFPERAEFDLYASMEPAKEVGGDFYDFFLVDENTLAIVMADVSGKGVPAALFMVITKTLIKNNTLYGKSPKDVFETVNNLLCENNEAGMFVTAFLGYFDISTGRFTYVNAGHNPPLIKRGMCFEWLKEKPGFVLAGMEDMCYKQYEVTLKPGDELFLYTDGVTEAVNQKDELFTDPRLLETANRYLDLPLKEFTVSIKREIDKFADGAEQADDITMLALRYKG